MSEQGMHWQLRSPSASTIFFCWLHARSNCPVFNPSLQRMHKLYWTDLPRWGHWKSAWKRPLILEIKRGKPGGGNPRGRRTGPLWSNPNLRREADWTGRKEADWTTRVQPQPPLLPPFFFSSLSFSPPTQGDFGLPILSPALLQPSRAIGGTRSAAPQSRQKLLKTSQILLILLGLLLLLLLHGLLSQLPKWQRWWPASASPGWPAHFSILFLLSFPSSPPPQSFLPPSLAHHHQIIKSFKQSRRVDVSGLVPMSATMTAPRMCWMAQKPDKTDCLAYEARVRRCRVLRDPPSVLMMDAAAWESVNAPRWTGPISSSTIDATDSPAVIASTSSASSDSAVERVTMCRRPARQTLFKVMMKHPNDSSSVHNSHLKKLGSSLALFHHLCMSNLLSMFAADILELDRLLPKLTLWLWWRWSPDVKCYTSHRDGFLWGPKAVLQQLFGAFEQPQALAARHQDTCWPDLWWFLLRKTSQFWRFAMSLMYDSWVTCQTSRPSGPLEVEISIPKNRVGISPTISGLDVAHVS